MYLSFRQSLLLGFGVILSLFICTSAYVYYETGKIHSIEERLLDNRLPTVLVAEKLLDGIDLSLAGLRGYMILGADPEKAELFKAERAAGWAKIDDMLSQYETLSANWDDADNLRRLEEMKVIFEEFRQAQQDVEDIAHAPNNIAAIEMLLTEAAPRASLIAAAITAMINEENTLPATPERKALLKLMADSRGSFLGGVASIRAYLLSGDQQFRDTFDRQWAINVERLEQISSQSALLNSVQSSAWQDYRDNHALFAPLPPEMFSLRTQPDWNKANYWLGTEAAPRAGKIKVILKELADSQTQAAELDKQLLYAEEVRLETITLGTTFVSVIIGIAIALTMSHSLVSQLRAMTSNAYALAEGDLSMPDVNYGRIKEFNKLAKALNKSKAKLNDLVANILTSSKGMAAQSTTLEDLIDESQKVINQQEKDTRLIENAINDMGGAVSDVARSTTDAAQSAEEADSSADKGHRVVLETVDNINQLATAIEDAAETINQLSDQTNEVDSILVSISGIADQTNLLALNAAIEAARAGEQGRGFAVVADEVRTLAASTQESTVEIRNMLERLKQGAKDAVEVMGEGHKQAQESVERGNVAKDTLQEIAGTMNTIKDMNTHIVAAVEQQRAVTEDMSSSISTISNGAKKVVEYSDQSLDSAHQVAVLAKAVADSASVFTLNKSA